MNSLRGNGSVLPKLSTRWQKFTFRSVSSAFADSFVAASRSRPRFAVARLAGSAMPSSFKAFDNAQTVYCQNSCSSGGNPGTASRARVCSPAMRSNSRTSISFRAAARCAAARAAGSAPASRTASFNSARRRRAASSRAFSRSSYESPPAPGGVSAARGTPPIPGVRVPNPAGPSAESSSEPNGACAGTGVRR